MSRERRGRPRPAWLVVTEVIIRKLPALKRFTHHPSCHVCLFEDVQRYSSTLSQCFVTVVAKSCEGLLGQLVATVADNQPGEIPMSSSLKPCDGLDE